MEYFEYFKKKIAEEEYSSVLAKWPECLESRPSPDELEAILKLIRDNRTLASVFQDKEERTLINIWDSFDKEQQQTHRILSLIIDLICPNKNSKPLSEDFVKFLRNYLGKKYKDHPHFEENLTLVGLGPLGKDTSRAIAKFDLLVHLKKGSYLLHAGWGVGQVLEVSYPQQGIRCEFEMRSQPQFVSFEHCLSNLSPILENSFLARRYNEPDTLWEEGNKDPVKLVKTILEELGPKTAGELKTLLFELVVLKEDWTAWWNKARASLKKQPQIISPATSDAKGKYAIRQESFSLEEQLKESLAKESSSEKVLNLINQFIKAHPKSLSKEFTSFLVSTIQSLVKKEGTPDSLSVEALFLLNDLGEKNEGQIKEKILSLTAPALLINELKIQSYKKRALLEIQQARKDAAEVFLELLFSLDQNHLREFLFNELVAAEQLENFTRKAHVLIADPHLYPEMTLWYFQKVIKEPGLPLSSPKERPLFLQALFLLLHRIENETQHADLTKKLHILLFEKTYKILREILEQTSLSEAKELLLLAAKCRSFSDHQKKILHALISVKHPSLGKEEALSFAKIGPDFLWCTQQGLNKLREDIEHIGSVAMFSANADLKIAKSYGDLKENHEYKSAMEKVKELQNNLIRLATLNKNHHVLLPQDVTTDKVWIGSVVDYAIDGSSESLVILGPFDLHLNLGIRIISYQTAIAGNLEGLRVGDKFILQGKEAIIKNIRSFFDIAEKT